MDKITTIIDTDPGVDDAFALAFLNKSEIFDLKMISAVGGNVSLSSVSRNIRGLLGVMGWDVPIYEGAHKALLAKDRVHDGFHGTNGLSGYEFNDDQLAKLEKASAIEAMARVLEENAKTLIIAIGPLTNIALLLSQYPHLKEKISAITMMGGVVGMGNITPVAEFNVYSDPEAADIVFRSGVAINMLGLNVTTQTSYDKSMHEKFKNSDQKINQLLAKIMENRLPKPYYPPGVTTYLHDLCAVIYHHKPEIFKAKKVYMAVETKGEITRGMTVLDERHNAPEEKNVNLITAIDVEEFKALVIETMVEK